MDNKYTPQEQSLERILEAVLSVSESPLSVVKMRNLFPEEGRPPAEKIEVALKALSKHYDRSALELVKLAGGYRFHTRAAYSSWITKLFETRPPKLSRAMLETLAIIAYQQPVTRGDIQEVRGVAVSSDMIQRLLEREWIKIIGERDVPGRPSLLGTTPEFLAYFNLSSLKDLPELHEPRELDEIARDLGQVAERHDTDQDQNQTPDDVKTDIIEEISAPDTEQHNV